MSSITVRPESVPGERIRRLPLVTLYLTERCNSRCISCDHWRTGRADVSEAVVERLLPGLFRLQTRVALISGGEPLLHPRWRAIASVFRAAGIKTWLLTSGLALAKHAAGVAEVFDAVTVSLDGTNAATYRGIRGLDAFDKVCEGIERIAAMGCRTGIRVTLQRSNFRELDGFVSLAHRLRCGSVSFLAADSVNQHAFGRAGEFRTDTALRETDLPVFARLIDELEISRAADFSSGFILESPAKLRRLRQYFAAVCGLQAYPPVRCNAPELSAVIAARGDVHPCFFIPGNGAELSAGSLEDLLNDEPMIRLRRDIRLGLRTECVSCVCSLYREPARIEETILP
jgi:MoaA/NifB/PqqE/SkfB family radical SAM enzyme